MLIWLKSDRYAKKVKLIRTIEDKAERDRLKAILPAITPSGLFSHRKESDLQKHSGLMQFDADWKDNTHIKNFSELKQQIANITNVAYVGMSVSGLGYWGLVPIAHPHQHKSQFRALHKSFKKFYIHIDTTPQNLASLRGYSYDPEAYFNHNATPFSLLDKPSSSHFTKQKRTGNGTVGDVYKIIQLINERGLDITSGYDKWLRIGFALADEFGEAGREYFHAISQYHPEYQRDQTDKQYTYCLQSNGQGVTIATLFHIAKEHCLAVRESTAPTPGNRNFNIVPNSNSLQSNPYGTNPYTGEVFDERGYPSSWDAI